MYFCKICNQLDEQGISGHHTRCHVVANTKVVANNVARVATSKGVDAPVPVRKTNLRTKDRHKNKEARLVYARNLMRKRRAEAKQRAA